ncbi:MAG: DUF3168 domain-containing protein [Pseudomonadota bacterium]
MTYVNSEPLQAAIFSHLQGDAGLIAAVGSAIYDAPPPNALDLPSTHVTIGEEQARDASSVTSRAAVHEFTVSIHTSEAGFQKAKEAATAVCEALQDAPLTLSRGRLVSLRFLSARSERNTARRPRRVLLRFRAFVEDAG